MTCTVNPNAVIPTDEMARYSSVLMDHFTSPRNVGRVDSPDAVGETGSPQQPPFMVMTFRINDFDITEARYQTFGCGPAIAAGSVLTEMIKGQSLQNALAITKQQLAEALGGLPEDKLWLAELAIATLHKALDGYESGGRLSRTNPHVGG